jgi:glycosyltransferase involved in cell wall biosynthesis
MKIAIVDPSLFTYHHDHMLANALVEQGHDVHLFGRQFRRHESQLVTRYKFRPIFYKYFDTIYKQSVFRPLFIACKGAEHVLGMLKLLLIVRRQRYDAVHFQWLPFPLVDIYIIEIIKKWVNVVVSVHDSSPYNGSPTSKLQAVGLFRAARKSSEIICHTNDARQRLLEHGIFPDKISVIRTGPLIQCESKTNYGHSKGNAVRLLLFGAIKPYKGLDILIRSLYILKSNGHDVDLLVSGSPCMDLAEVKKYVIDNNIQENITWDLRYIPEHEVCGIISSCDIVTFPYYQIDSSGVFSSVILLKKPVIATNIGVFREMITNYETGLLVEPGDATSLAEAIARLARDPGFRDQLATAALKKLGPQLDWSTIAKQTQGVYIKSQLRSHD